MSTNSLAACLPKRRARSISALVVSWLDHRLFGAGVSINTKILNPGAAFLSTKTSAVFVMYKQLVKNFAK